MVCEYVRPCSVEGSDDLTAEAAVDPGVFFEDLANLSPMVFIAEISQSIDDVVHLVVTARATKRNHIFFGLCILVDTRSVVLDLKSSIFGAAHLAVEMMRIYLSLAAMAPHGNRYFRGIHHDLPLSLSEFLIS